MVGKMLIRLSIGGSSFSCIVHGICIQSFHQLFLYTRSLDIEQLVVSFQSLGWFREQMRLKRNRRKINFCH